MRNGVAAFNGVIVGLVGTAVYPAFYSTDRTVELWSCLAVGALARLLDMDLLCTDTSRVFFPSSIYVCKSLDRFLGKADLPYLAAPFNIIIVCVFLTLRPDAVDPSENDGAPADPSFPDAANATAAEDPAAVNWCMFGRGVLVSMSQVMKFVSERNFGWSKGLLPQVWGIDDVATAATISLALFFFSPLLLVLCNVGAVMGSLLGKVHGRWEEEKKYK